MLLDWPNDVTHLADALKLERFALFGWSGGGPYALACAYKIPHRVTRVGTSGCMAPLEPPIIVSELGLFADRILFPLACHAPWLALALLAIASRQTPAMLKHSLLCSYIVIRGSSCYSIHEYSGGNGVLF